ncbi:MAG: energy transducer TonB [Thermodesulfovibrionales bacterium]
MRNREFKAFVWSFGLHAMIFMTFFVVSSTMLSYPRPIIIDFSIEDSPDSVREDVKRSLPVAKREVSKKTGPLKNQRSLGVSKEIFKEEAKREGQSVKESLQRPVTESLSEEQVPVPSQKEVAGSPVAKPVITDESARGDAGHDSRKPNSASISNAGDSIERSRQRYLKEHFTYIRDIIMKNLAYPHMARKMGWEGRVTVSFVVFENGSASDIKILESSGFDILDRNAMETVKKVSPFPKPPVRAEVIIPIVYKLN